MVEDEQYESEAFIDGIRKGMLDDDDALDLADLFRIFSDSTRIKILWALQEHEMCVRGISKALDISMSACSHQLKTLRDMGLVETRRDGKMVYYHLSDEHVNMLLKNALVHIREE